MRQEQERMRQLYEERSGNSGDSKRIKELESELEKTKSYYNKRIREIEEKHKYGGALKKAASQKSESHRSKDDSNLNDLRDQNERLLQERNTLAQKVAEYESQSQNKIEFYPAQTVEENNLNPFSVHSVHSSP